MDEQSTTSGDLLSPTTYERTYIIHVTAGGHFFLFFSLLY